MTKQEKENKMTYDDHFTFRYCDQVYAIPEGMRLALMAYVETGLHPGRFLYELLCGNWVTAIGAADGLNMPNLPAYANYLYNHAPYNCYGSRELVDSWMEKGGMKGKEATNDLPNP